MIVNEEGESGEKTLHSIAWLELACHLHSKYKYIGTDRLAAMDNRTAMDICFELLMIRR